MKIVNLHNPVDNESFIGWGERGYITRLSNEIREASPEDVILSLNTPGGSVFDGYNILAAIDDHKGKVIARVEGLAASMGAYFLAYADEAEARENSRIMIHKAFNRYSDPNDPNYEESIKELNIINEKLALTFIKKGMRKELVDEIFSEENKKNYWFSASEALEVGLIDRVIPSGRESNAIAANLDDLQKLSNKYGFWQAENINYSQIKGHNEMGLLTNKDKEEFLSQLTELRNAVEEFTNFKAEFETLKENFSEITAMNNSVDDTNAVMEHIKSLENKITSLESELNSQKDMQASIIEGIQQTSNNFIVPKIEDSTSAKIEPLTQDAKSFRKEIKNQINNRTKV